MFFRRRKLGQIYFSGGSSWGAFRGRHKFHSYCWAPSLEGVSNISDTNNGMKFLLKSAKYGTSPRLKGFRRHLAVLRERLLQLRLQLILLLQEVGNRPNIPLQEQFHRGILRGLRNISDTP